MKCDHASGIAWDRHFPAIPPLLRRDWKLNRDAFEAPQSEELPEGLYLATSDELPGLEAQGRTVSEALGKRLPGKNVGKDADVLPGKPLAECLGNGPPLRFEAGKLI